MVDERDQIAAPGRLDAGGQTRCDGKDTGCCHHAADDRVEAARRGDLVTLINHGDEAVWIDFDGTDAETGAAVGVRELAPQGVIFAMAPAVAEQPARLAAAR